MMFPPIATRIMAFDTALIVADEAPPTRHPAECSFDDPAARQNFKAPRAFTTANDLDDEIKVGGLVHQFQPVICRVCEEMLHPWPALADGVENGLRADAVGDVCRRQVDHEQPPVCIHRNVALATNDLLARIETPCRRMWSLD